MDQYKYPPARQSWIIWCLGVAFYFSGFFHRMITALFLRTLYCPNRLDPCAFLPPMPLWLVIVVFGLVGIASSAIVINFAFIKESVPPALAGSVTGVCNMGMEMGPMMLQPAIGWVPDFRWNGLSEIGIRIYDLSAYHLAFGTMIVLSLFGTLILPFARETYCQQLQE